MRHMKCIKAACAALLLTAGSAASAANLVLQDGKLTGATGVNIGGTLYDVQFVEGTCVSLFNGCDEASDFDFTDEMSATTAAQALLDQVLVDGPSGNFDAMPSLTFGCISILFCASIIPYSLGPIIANNNVFSVAVINRRANFDNEILSAALFPRNAGDGDGANFAKFSLSPIAAVPEPSAWALMILGFSLVGAATRRRTAARRLLA